MFPPVLRGQVNSFKHLSQGLQAHATVGEGRKRLAPQTPDVREPPSEEGCPLHGWADTDFPRVSNTTSRHPFDTLVTGMLTNTKRRLSHLFLCAPNVFEVTFHIRFSDVCFASSCGGVSADTDVDVDVNADDKADADADVVDG